MGIKNDLQKKKWIFYARKKHLEKSNKNTRVKVWIYIVILSLFVNIMYSKCKIFYTGCSLRHEMKYMHFLGRKISQAWFFFIKMKEAHLWIFKNYLWKTKIYVWKAPFLRCLKLSFYFQLVLAHSLQ